MTSLFDTPISTPRQTSIKAYYEIERLGLLSKRRLQVLKALAEHGPMTANEIWKKIVETDEYCLQHSISPRLAELRERGCVLESGVKVWDGSGHEAILWDFTGQRPIEPLKRPSELQRLRAENVALRNQVETLKKVLTLKEDSK